MALREAILGNRAVLPRVRPEFKTPENSYHKMTK